MPKKFVGTNSKAAEARARKETAQKEKEVLKQKAVDDKYWEENDPKMQKKSQRKADKEQKKQLQIERKNEIKSLEEQEMNSLVKVNKHKKDDSVEAKKTRTQIVQFMEKLKMADNGNKVKDKKIQIVEETIPENMNRLIDMGSVAQSVDEAIIVLNQSTSAQSTDMHPERRQKAAHQAFENEMIPKLKAENPTLKLSQIKQMVWKEWQKISNCNPNK